MIAVLLFFSTLTQEQKYDPQLNLKAQTNDRHSGVKRQKRQTNRNASIGLRHIKQPYQPHRVKSTSDTRQR